MLDAIHTVTTGNDPSCRLGSFQPYRVVIVGGSYAGLSAALTLIALKEGREMPFASHGNYAHLKHAPQVRNLNITILDQRDGFFHTVGAPLAHISPTHANSMWKQYTGFKEFMRPDLRFLQGTATSINPTTQTLTYDDVHGMSQYQPYDYLLVSTGMQRKWPVTPKANSLLSYLKDASDYADSIKVAGKLGVVIIGGGAVGVEFAGKIKSHYPNVKVILIHSRDQLLSNEPLPDEFKTRALELLQNEGVRVILGQRVTADELPDGTSYIKFLEGNQIHAGLVLMAVSKVSPATSFVPSASLAKDKTILVDYRLRVMAGSSPSDTIFAAGDVVQWEGMKLGGSAMVMGNVAGANIYSSVLSRENICPPAMEECPVTQPKMALSIGDNAICFAGGDSEVQHGADIGEAYFGSDMGWQRVLVGLGLWKHK
ncbi:hypothetical protein N7495_005549 [Penicillium taxi]|uniref:uncharacterized protein n=1 Tax=Penicillium taxi TaxID=168475 RepID=UPI00254565DD|nr:uncharacterized protein N7495_005549 [Penicillium taxi]KAJ5893858.1 hypothetical protein N7495_005549 [Penicillium taxi]